MRISDWSSDVCSSDLLVIDEYDNVVETDGYVTFSAVDPEPLQSNVLVPVRLEFRENTDTAKVALAWRSASQQFQAIPEHTLFYSSEVISSEALRVGKECVSTCRSRLSTYP